MALKEDLRKQGDFLFKYRSYLPLVLLVAGICTKIYQETTGNGKEINGEELMGSAAIFLGFLGLGIRVVTIGYTPKNTSGRNTTEGQIAAVLNTKGMYSLTRNPLYLGNYFMWASIAMLTGNIWFVLLFSLGFWIYYERIIYAEEDFLRNRFGRPYLEWAAKTPIFLPRNLRYKKPDLPFNWKKVARNEKSGLLYLFLLFWFFETLGEYIEEGRLVIEENWIYFGLASSSLLYLVLKYLKTKSMLLNKDGK